MKIRIKVYPNPTRPMEVSSIMYKGDSIVSGYSTQCYVYKDNLKILFRLVTNYKASDWGLVEGATKLSKRV